VSRENVEIVRRLIDHFNETGEPIWAEIDPDVVWVIDPPAWLAGPTTGTGGSGPSWRAWQKPSIRSAPRSMT
jgi:hypothetical protein